ncbi:MAG TPA: hypothetical protein ACQGQH_01900 [Xylella sp.]
MAHWIFSTAIGESLISFPGRLQQGHPLPILTEHVQQRGGEAMLHRVKRTTSQMDTMHSPKYPCTGLPLHLRHP